LVVQITFHRMRLRKAGLLRKSLSGITLLSFLSSFLIVFGVATFYGAGTLPAKVPAKVPASQALQRRIALQRSALASGNAEAIVKASRGVVALALEQMAQWRLKQGAYLQAIVLCHRSLLIEDSAETKAVLAKAESEVAKRNLDVPKDLSAIDPAASPSDAVLRQAKLTVAEMERGRLEEKRLRRILSAAYNDWGAADAGRQEFLAAMGNFQAAEKWDASTPGLMRNLGLAAAKVGDNGEAVRALKVAVKTDPKDKQSRLMLAVSLFGLGEFSDAAKYFDEVGDAVLADPEMGYAWAFSLSRANQVKQAKAVLDKVSASASLPAEMLILIGKVYNDVGDHANALRCFQGAIRQDPTMKQAHGGAGVSLIRLNRPAEAVPELEAELKLSPADPDAQYQLGYALLQLSKEDQAIPILRTLIAAHPDHARARYQLGKTLLDMGQVDEAIQNLQAAANMDSDRAYIHYQLQKAYRKTGKIEAADRELKLYQDLKTRDRERIQIDGENNMQSESTSD